MTSKQQARVRIYRPLHSFARRRPALLLILLSGVLLTGLLTAGAVSLTARSLIRSFDKEATRQLASLRKTLDRSVGDVGSLRWLFECSEQVSRDEFQQFSASTLKDSTWISAVSWVPRVPAEQRQRYEMLARAEGMEGFYFQESNSDSHYRPVAARTEYYPVYYLEPYRGYSEWLGVDLGADPERMKLFERSRNLALPVIQVLSLFSQQKERSEVELFFPVYDRTGVTFTVTGRQESLRGFSGALLDIKRGLACRLDQFDPSLSLLLDDVTERDNPICLLQEREWQSARSRVPFLFKELYYEEIFPIADRFWRIRCRPGPAYQFGPIVWMPVAVLAVGLCLTGLLSLYLLTLHSRHEVTEQLVKTRTAELEHQKQVADQMARRAEEANKAKSIFLANMSHEIRTPMSAILGFADLLMDTDLAVSQREYVGLIRESGKTLLALINDILDFSKIEAGKLTIEQVDCRLPDLLRSIYRILEPTASGKGIEFRVQVPDRLPVTITGDPVRIHQCLMNLISNAIKFTESGHVRLLAVMEERHGKPWVRFEVEDTGIGIAADRLEQIFEAFTQSDSSTTRRFGGTGLGLTISRRLAEMMGGNLFARSEPGKGSVFTLVIPANISLDQAELFDFDSMEKKSELAEGSREAEELHFYGRILVAEDSPANQLLIRKMLEKYGLEVCLVSNGREAVEKALHDSFDLVFMDIQMPEMNGYEATYQIRKAGGVLPIVALTANAMKGDEESCLEAGCDAYLSKPIHRERLVSLLKQFLVCSGKRPEAKPEIL